LTPRANLETREPTRPACARPSHPSPPKYLYLPAATVLKRWAGETAGAVFVHVDESLQGMDVIRAFGAVDYFIQVGLALGEGLGGTEGRADGCSEGSLQGCGLGPTHACVCRGRGRGLRSETCQRRSAPPACPPFQENVARLNRHDLALFNTEQTHLWLAFWWATRAACSRRLPPLRLRAAQQPLLRP
jgi:hypothetical protein